MTENVNSTKNKANGPSKSFMTAGPTLHYSHSNVLWYWAISVVVYLASCLFWSKIMTGTALSIDISNLIDPVTWGLGQYIIAPLSIYEYPWQMVVISLVMAVLTVSPLLISQLLSFRYCIFMLVLLVFIAKLPLFASSVAFSCLAVACRPLRFRSRFIALALCMAPQLVYWAVYGGYENVDPVKWAFSFAPWIGAWLTALGMAGIVIAIGHFTRYRPGLVWSVTLAVLLAAIGVFEWKISSAELDYQLYVAHNDPEQVTQFQDHNLSDVIDQAMNNPRTRRFLAGFFYPSDKELLRKALKNDIEVRLADGRWPNWMDVPSRLDYQNARLELLGQYDKFINKYKDRLPLSNRLPIALYYKAVLSEYTPDIKSFKNNEVLSFYKDYPHPENWTIWYAIYNDFPSSPESIEARWRMAVHWSGRTRFEDSSDICKKAMRMIDEHEKWLESQERARLEDEGTFLTAFTMPAKTVITQFKLSELKIKISRLLSLINEQNYTIEPESKQRLADFVTLNSHSLQYADKVKDMLEDTEPSDPLRDNLLLANILLMDNLKDKVDGLTELRKKFPHRDASVTALYELAMLKVKQWKEIPQEQAKLRKDYLNSTRETLNEFMELYPDSILSGQAKTTLERLPAIEQ